MPRIGGGTCPAAASGQCWLWFGEPITAEDAKDAKDGKEEHNLCVLRVLCGFHFALALGRFGPTMGTCSSGRTRVASQVMGDSTVGEKLVKRRFQLAVWRP